MNKNSILKNSKFIEGILIALTSLFFIGESLKLHNGKSWALSPALFPLIITVSILFFSISLIIKSLKEEDIAFDLKRGEIIKLGLIILISFLYLIILPKLNFLYSTIIYLFLFLIILGERKWWMLVAMSIITPLSIQYIFGNLLNVLLP